MTPQDKPLDRHLITPAFISAATFEVDGQHYPGVFTVDRYSPAGVDITIHALGKLPGYGDLAVLIDSGDLAAVNALLRQQHLAEADDETDA